MTLATVACALAGRLLLDKYEYQEKERKLEERTTELNGSVDDLTRQRDNLFGQLLYLRSAVESEINQSTRFRGPSVQRLQAALHESINPSVAEDSSNVIDKPVLEATDEAVQASAQHKVTMI